MSKPLPETLRKMQEREEKQKAEYLKKKEALVAEAAVREQKIIARSKQFAAELVQQEKAVIAAKADASKTGSFYVPAEAKVALVIRIRGCCRLSPQVRKILVLLRLPQKNHATFVRLNKATLEMLKRVESCIAYGYPSAQLVHELVHKIGCAAINKQRIALTSNTLVHAMLGKYGIESVDDVCHEIYTCGPNFSVANRFIAPFKLHPPTGGLREISRHYVEGGDFGNREYYIDDLVRRMI